MAIYILVLSAVPCSDAHNSCNKTVETEQNTEHSHEHDSDDNCSPFCICNCCGSHIAVIEIPFYSLNVHYSYSLVEKVALRNDSFIATFFNNIWQPPKITA
jgi:hypothetical protein